MPRESVDHIVQTASGPNGMNAMASEPSYPQAVVSSVARPSFRRVDGLFDLELRPGPDGELRTLRGPGQPVKASDLAELVRRTGGGADDIRITMSGDARFAPIFAELAQLLVRDVLIAPAGSEPRTPSESGPAPTGPTPTGSSDPVETILVDTATGLPADWQVVQPPAMATDLPGWFETRGGTVRERRGTVMLPMPGGVMLATRADFVARRGSAATLMAGHAELATIGAPVRGGGFVIGDYSGGHEVADGRRLAAALASLPLYGAEVRMWITWPSDRDEQERLHRNLTGFAETTGAIVWAPTPNATTEVLDSCRDLSVTARDGRPAAWQVYTPSAADETRFASDADGRLSPAGELITMSTEGVPLISVGPARWHAAAERYEAITPREGMFVIELTVLSDGRWAVQYVDFGPHVLGPHEFQRLLRSAGWRGEDLAVLSRYPAAAAEGVRRYGRHLVDELGAEVWVLPRDAGFDVHAGAPRAIDRQGRPVEWHRVGVDAVTPSRWRTADGVLVPNDQIPPATAPDGSASAEAVLDPAAAEQLSPAPDASSSAAPASTPDVPTQTGWPGPAQAPRTVVDAALSATSRDEWERTAARTDDDRAPAATGPASPSTGGLSGEAEAVADSEGDAGTEGVAEGVTRGDVPEEGTPGKAAATPLPAGRAPQLHRARSKLKHGLDWLADRPRVNAEPVELYVVCSAPPDRVADEGLPTSQLFVAGSLQPPAPESLEPGDSLLRVRVDEGGAVDLSSIDVHVPPTLHLLLASRSGSYLLPAGLLSRTHLLAGYPADPDHGFGPAGEFSGGPSLRLRSAGSRHGVDGLPTDVPRWPRTGDATAYALVPAPRVGTALTMLRSKPRVRPGHRLLQLRVPRRRAIDVRAAADQLVGLSSVRSAAGMLAGKDIELLLPGRELDQVTVVEVLAPGRLGWKQVSDPDGVTLSEFLDTMA
jgi:hypothetical protein